MKERSAVTIHGYLRIPHPSAKKSALEHVVVSEKALGKKLPKGAEVHHVDEDKLNNDPGNLVICPDRAYHMLIHQRTDALNACGHADWLKCPYCKEYDAPDNMRIKERANRPGATTWYHVNCLRKYAKERYWMKKAEAEAA